MIERIATDRRRWPHSQYARGGQVHRPAAAVVNAALRCDAGPRVNRHVLLALAASTRPDGRTSLRLDMLASLTALPEVTVRRVVLELIAAGHVSDVDPIGGAALMVHPRNPAARGGNA